MTLELTCANCGAYLTPTSHVVRDGRNFCDNRCHLAYDPEDEDGDYFTPMDYDSELYEFGGSE